jgi:hypothetical protein
MKGRDYSYFYKVFFVCTSGCPAVRSPHIQQRFFFCRREPERQSEDHAGTKNLVMNHHWATPMLNEDGEPEVQLEIKTEKLLLERALNECTGRHLQIDYRSAVSHDEEFISHATDCHIAHFSAHGEPGKLKLEYKYEPFSEKLGKSNVMTADDIVDLGNLKRVPGLVFASVCHSQDIGAEFLNIGVGHVIAIDR